MQLHTTEEREELFAQASPLQREMYASPEYGTQLRAIADKHGVTEQHYTPFALSVGEVILGLASQKDLPELFETNLGIDHGKAIKLTADVIDFLAPLTNQSDAPQDDLQSEIAETEAQLQTVVPIRTMDSDKAKVEQETAIPKADDEPVIQSSSQDQIFGKRPVLGDTPTYEAKPAEPRWQTDDEVGG